jgi:hypothetical protein
VSEFVTQYWISMYYNSWNICKATSHCFLDCSSDQGTIIKAKWQLSSKCPSSYSILKTSIASRIRATTGGLPGIPCPNHIFSDSRNSRRCFCRVRRKPSILRSLAQLPLFYTCNLLYYLHRIAPFALHCSQI